MRIVFYAYKNLPDDEYTTHDIALGIDPEYSVGGHPDDFLANHSMSPTPYEVGGCAIVEGEPTPPEDMEVAWEYAEHPQDIFPREEGIPDEILDALVNHYGHVKCLVEEEYGPEEFWADLRQKFPALTDALESGWVVLTPAFGASVEDWCKRQQNWGEGPEYAPDPLIFE